jgi:shikimate kinase
MVITLIGYRGSGKSTVAPPLAARLGWSWADADPLIEQAAGCSIREIFAAEGEAGFRHRERQTIALALGRDRLVLAAGGGAILNAETRRDLKVAGPVVWLRARLETLAARIAGDPATASRRPDLAGGGPREIARLLAAREPLYRECASLTIDTEGLSIDEIVDSICRQLPGLPP